MYGEEGNDWLIGGPAADSLYGDTYCCVPRSGGDDIVFGGGGDDYVDGYWGNDRVNGAHGNDIVDDEAGVDLLAGGFGDDEITTWDPKAGSSFVGGEGSDRLEIVYGDRVVANLATGRISQPVRASIASIEEVWGSDGPDRFVGTNADETFVSFGGDDIVVASGGNDRMYTYDGDDHLDGGAGSDRGNAGPGTDVCVSVERASHCESTG